MASSSAADPEPETCAVLKAWQKSEQVMNRMMQGCLVHLPANCKKIQRVHLGENVDLLGPLLAELGPLPQILCRARCAPCMITMDLTLVCLKCL